MNLKRLAPRTTVIWIHSKSKISHMIEGKFNIEPKNELQKAQDKRIIFPVKAEIPYFTKMQKGGQKGGQGRSYVALKHASKIENLKKILNFSIKIARSLVPLLAPILNF